MEARVPFSFDNPQVNVIGKPKVNAYAVFERPLLRPRERTVGGEMSQSPLLPTSKRFSKDKQKT